MINQIIFCVTGTIAFAITMNAPKKSLIYIFAGSTICSFTERLFTSFYGDFTACFCAMFVVSFFCEIVARHIKMPTTVILIPCTIPLLPGSAIYYTMLYAIQGDLKKTGEYALSTLLTGMGIALGTVIESALIKISSYYRKGS